MPIVNIESACPNIGWVAVFGARRGRDIEITLTSFPMWCLIRKGKGKALQPVPWVPANDYSFEVADRMEGYLGVDPEPTGRAVKETLARWEKYVKDEGIDVPNAEEEDDDTDPDEDPEDEDEDDPEDEPDEDEDEDEGEEPAGRARRR